MNTYDADRRLNYLERIYRDICCKVKSCLGIKSTADGNKFLNQKGEWTNVQSLPFTGTLSDGSDYLFGELSLVNDNDSFGLLVSSNNNLYFNGYSESSNGLSFTQLNINDGTLISITTNSIQKSLTLISEDINGKSQIDLSPGNIGIQSNTTYLLEFDTANYGLAFFDKPPVPQQQISALNYAALVGGTKDIADALIAYGLLVVN